MHRSYLFLCILILLLASCSQNTRPISEKAAEKRAASAKFTVVDPATAGMMKYNDWSASQIELRDG